MIMVASSRGRFDSITLLHRMALDMDKHPQDGSMERASLFQRNFMRQGSGVIRFFVDALPPCRLSITIDSSRMRRTVNQSLKREMPVLSQSRIRRGPLDCQNGSDTRDIDR